MKSQIFLPIWFGWGETTELRRNQQTQGEHEQIHLNGKLRLQHNQEPRSCERQCLLLHHCSVIKNKQNRKKNNTLTFKQTLQFQGSSITAHCHHTVITLYHKKALKKSVKKVFYWRSPIYCELQKYRDCIVTSAEVHLIQLFLKFILVYF